MSAKLTRLGDGDYTAGEGFWLVEKRRAAGEGFRPPLIFCHQHQTPAKNIAMLDYYQALLFALAEDFTVIAPDLGYNGGCDVWGNDTHTARITGARNYLASYMGSSPQVTLVAASHGNLGAMNWTKLFPQLVAGVAGILPALSLASLKQVNGGAYAACIDSAHGGTYSDAVQGPDYSPYIYRASYPATVPTAIWTTPNDAICLPQWSTSFAAATGCKNYSLVDGVGAGYGHTEAGIAAAVPSVIEWVRGARTLG